MFRQPSGVLCLGLGLATRTPLASPSITNLELYPAVDNEYSIILQDKITIALTFQHPPYLIARILPDFLQQSAADVKRPVFTRWCDGSPEIYAVYGEQQMLVKVLP